MYPYPQPYQAPAYGPPPRARTPQGLRWAMVGLVLVLMYFAVTALLGFLLGQILGGPPPTTFNEFLGRIAGLLAAALITVILGILVLVFYFIGFGFLYGGRNEFGPTHARNLKISLVLVILALSLGIANLVAVAIINGQGLRFTGGFPGTWEVNPGMFYLGAAVNAVLGITVAALVAAHLVLSVRALAKPKHEIVLYAAAALGTATPGIVGSLTLLQMPRFIAFIEALVEAQTGTFFTPPSVDPAVGTPMIVGGALGALAMALFLWVYRDAGARLRTGELKPVLPAPTPVTTWMPAPVVPPPPAYPVPSVQPPGPQGPAP